MPKIPFLNNYTVFDCTINLKVPLPVEKEDERTEFRQTDTI